MCHGMLKHARYPVSSSSRFSWQSEGFQQATAMAMTSVLLELEITFLRRWYWRCALRLRNTESAAPLAS